MKKACLLLFILFLSFTMNPEKKMAAESLQATIDSMEEGAVLKLENKTYEGNIIIHKSITIIGLSNTVIKGDGTGNVISIKAPNVRLTRIKILNSSMDRNTAEEFAGIKIHTDHNVIEHIKIRDSFHGIYLSQAHHNTIRDTDISGPGNGKIASQGNGLHVYYSNSNTFSANKIQGTRDGMFFEYANDNETVRNNISHTRYGLHYMFSDDNDFKNNIFTMNTGGAAIMNSKNMKLKNNEFIFNYGHRSFGLLLLSTNDIHIENNTFYLNQRGIYIDQSTNSEFKDNRIVQNQIGIELWASSSQQTFTENRIAENTIPAVTLGGKGKNTWSKTGKGNDWGNAFPLTDLNQDGIGDFPITYHSSLYQLIEDQELTYLFLKIPATKIYEKMNGFLQKEQIMFEDSHPIMADSKGHIPKGFIFLSGLSTTLILIKGRHRLCTTFGRNGKRT
jgi:nitrous oxidase accessory protein